MDPPLGGALDSLPSSLSSATVAGLTSGMFSSAIVAGLSSSSLLATTTGGGGLAGTDDGMAVVTASWGSSLCWGDADSALGIFSGASSSVSSAASSFSSGAASSFLSSAAKSSFFAAAKSESESLVGALSSFVSAAASSFFLTAGEAESDGASSFFKTASSFFLAAAGESESLVLDFLAARSSPSTSADGFLFLMSTSGECVFLMSSSSSPTFVDMAGTIEGPPRSPSPTKSVAAFSSDGLRLFMVAGSSSSSADRGIDLLDWNTTEESLIVDS
mmetsp:Transcript_2924/g.6327  ORF Transcript_2924/g.6327 Transcript_2924/m.6327 type:complete len:274 (+) Transcript_2924:2091-2912(+)